MSSDLWEEHAKWWQDGFSEGADAEYSDLIMPLAKTWLTGFDRVLDIGAGEGQIARQCVSNGASLVVGVDPTAAQMTEAHRRGGGPAYGRCDAAELPFAPACFDAAVACLVFEHIEAMDTAIREVARVLRPGGRFVFFLNHPLVQTPGSGWIDDHMVDPPEQYWRLGPYLVESNEVEQIAPGISLPFVHRPLHRYINALLRSGLNLVHMAEPSPPESFLEKATAYREAAAIPRLLLLVAEKAR